MNITFIDLDDIRNPLLAAGQARATYEVGRRLSQMGHRVTSLCSKYPGSIDRTEDGIRYIHIGLGSNNMKLNNLVYFFVVPWAVMKLKCDIIVECFTAPISTLFTPLFTRIPVVALPTVFSAAHFSQKYHIPLEWIERLGCQTYRYFMPYIDADIKKMKRYNPHINFRMIPQGVGDEFFDIPIRSKRDYILYLGRIDIAQKGLDLLIKAYAEIADKTIYPLIIAGHGPDEDVLKEMIKSSGAQKRIQFIGAAYGDKKQTLLAKAAYIVMPSRYDNLPLFSLEALASGQPLVVFDTEEFTWLNKAVSKKATAFDTHSYANMMITLDDEKTRAPMRTKARSIAKGFRWNNVAKKMERYFTDILHERSTT